MFFRYEKQSDVLIKNPGILERVLMLDVLIKKISAVSNLAIRYWVRKCDNFCLFYFFCTCNNIIVIYCIFIDIDCIYFISKDSIYGVGTEPKETQETSLRLSFLHCDCFRQ